MPKWVHGEAGVCPSPVPGVNAGPGRIVIRELPSVSTITVCSERLGTADGCQRCCSDVSLCFPRDCRRLGPHSLYPEAVHVSVQCGSPVWSILLIPITNRRIIAERRLIKISIEIASSTAPMLVRPVRAVQAGYVVLGGGNPTEKSVAFGAPGIEPRCPAPKKVFNISAVKLILEYVRTQHLHIVPPFESRRIRDCAPGHTSLHLPDRFILVFFHP